MLIHITTYIIPAAPSRCALRLLFLYQFQWCLASSEPTLRPLQRVSEFMSCLNPGIDNGRRCSSGAEHYYYSTLGGVAGNCLVSKLKGNMTSERHK
ncbi:uncharacterized protein EDB93DRAFT_1111605 [Suillus bovinus]|uniref:uncharacterized protein n=1 Tax=Suillus bovinus TaxID=48563 RepID=UPI001B8748B1|nr:uncharacterized protein EDB93DRAFT_1111605 [Suillus bovinus]KAG2159710.1 hypothetical protein EDB93DRAFT_1111605 [Suillus bovinus]